MSNTKRILMSTAILAAVAMPAFAAEGKKMKEVTSIVGYNVTEAQMQDEAKAKIYNKIDANSDGTMTFKEYRNYANVENEYDVFTRMDKDGSKNVSYNEFVTFNNTGKGSTQIESELHGKASVKGTNLKTRVIQEPRSYYVPVEPEVVKIENVEPAAE